MPSVLEPASDMVGLASAGETAIRDLFSVMDFLFFCLHSFSSVISTSVCPCVDFLFFSLYAFSSLHQYAGVLISFIICVVN